MEAGYKLDILIAEKVMGWTVDPIGRMYTGDIVRHCMGINMETRFNPSTDIAAAWEVCEKMREGFLVKIEDCYWSSNDDWLCAFYRDTEEEYNEVVTTTAPLAICLAALRAVGEDI